MSLAVTTDNALVGRELRDFLFAGDSLMPDL